ncbi:DNA/RNA non-specific endonuclease [Microbulbifer rhizosphaerae]|uniref:Type VII secretion system protein EssD-like domain-containing protein n=1 Tax=Microbulbifer rhizosphaerae TaxID=1562603 RepID=A0A7W4W8V4_9GAMM|nr:DNA/RNA non-specific endonuclease [Microbulbifer rhizosphaerae]MBB3059779.1 hypothetical protein [Microbulbifer rhizosphaerae]
MNIENRQGVRFRVREGWYYPPHLPQGFTEHFVDLPLLQSFDDAVLEQVCQKFLGFAQELPDPTNPHYRRQFESTPLLDPYAGAPAFFSDPGKRIYLALTQQRLIIEENPPGEEELAEQQSQLLQKIRMALRQIIAQERAEAAQHTQRLAQESHVNRALIYTGAFFNGLWNAGVDLAKWVKEVSDVVSPTQHLLRSIHASHRALQRNRENGENILTAYVDEHLKGEKRELVQALGFDPSAITREQFDQAMEIADLVWESPALRADLIRFAKDYVNAQHAIELTNLSGSAAFEILFTIVLAAVTAGAGLAASAASQARHLAKFRKVGDLLMEFAEHLKKVRQRLKRSNPGDKDRTASYSDLEVEEIVDSKPTSNSSSATSTSRIRKVKETYNGNEAEWTIDEQGRPTSVEATLSKSEKGGVRSSAETKLQQEVGGDTRLDSDEGGHIIGHRFMSDQGEKNLFPQNSNLNRGAYKKMENEWADWTNEGFEVKLKVSLEPPGAERPTNIISEYEVIDPKTGDIVFDRRHNFSNSAGEAFDRIPKADMQFYGE